MPGVVARERYENIELIDASILSLVTIHSYCISPFLSFLPPTFLWQVFGAQALHCCHGAVNQNKNGTRVNLTEYLACTIQQRRIMQFYNLTVRRYLQELHTRTQFFERLIYFLESQNTV